jgi:hypothetical protein
MEDQPASLKIPKNSMSMITTTNVDGNQTRMPHFLYSRRN